MVGANPQHQHKADGRTGAGMRATMQGGDPSQRGLYAHAKGCGWDIQTIMGRHTGSLQAWKRTGRLDLLIPRAGSFLPQWAPLGAHLGLGSPPVLGHNWQLSSLHPLHVHGAAPKPKHPTAPFHMHPGPPLPAAQPPVGLVAKVAPSSSLPTRSLQAGSGWAGTRGSAAR